MSREPEPTGMMPASDDTGTKTRKGLVFLERASYRRRRLTDAARLMPVLGALLWAVPMLWNRSVTSTSTALLYVFGIWVLLVIGAGMLSRGIAQMTWSGEDRDSEDGEHEGGAV
ncbi:hypothetical protein RXV86_17030 [Alisedimentitalea sp. MJ-SS2]|uniref:hypothetical protein n=1 Tax=Aliisedimentitalea sp. MJ-SS2 TaxID=3049795 RepID=UPI00290BB4C1|nr:hypothetical protein [Alisedimentitalea sp. MJ-SS2]MDU8929100.1 hypothetical protein [Alisedimentitalea sp. MJ-SS2]